MITEENDICAYCDLLIVFGMGFLLTKVYPEFISTIKTDVIVEDNLNYCGYIDNSFQFCKSYYGIIIEKKIRKFGSANCINISHYQKYSDISSDLTPVEKRFITCVHLFISIIKLRPSGSSCSILYYWI